LRTKVRASGIAGTPKFYLWLKDGFLMQDQCF